MKNAKNTQAPHHKHFYTIHIMSYLIIFALMFFGYMTLLEKLSTAYADLTVSNSEQSYEISRLQFCADRTIRPCTDDALRQWNTANPTDKFALSTFKERIDELHLKRYY